MSLNRQRALKATLLCSGVLAALFAQQAMAAGFQISELSPSLQGAALAGAGATSNDPSAMTYNPATLATVKGTQVNAGVSEIVPSVGYTNATVQGIPAGVTSQNSISPAATVPDFYFATTMPEKIHVGIAVNAPWGLSTEYPSDWTGNADAVKSAISGLNIAPTIAYQVSKYFAVGASFNAQYINVEYSQNYPLFDGFDPVPIDMTGNAWGFGYTLGTLITPVEGTNIGISYRSKVTESIDGNAQIGAAPADINLPVTTSITLPESVNIGLSQKITQKWTGLATAEWIRWDRMQGINLTIPIAGTTGVPIDNTLEWKNTWLFSLGSLYQIDDQWVLRGGVAYDQTPTQDLYRDARIPDSNRYWVTVGAGYTPIKSLTLNVAYEHIFMMPQSINIPTTDGQLTADYHGCADIFAASANWTF